ncbi:putative GRAM domain-containing protein [Medicago truncatula]|uniref:GRAM domain protein/ABA-responsive-like protein n=1 Tax=Medicago truncatula TaxID=3880 RepID=A0A072VRY5_MEDTR|nr:putative GEM-like protein 8 [Medicago truncatula]KEH44426.1 GRAM domain protein/ABA-responsive-like protein [Medicago truncatula]RHN82655.1 putative GRAM domain-containing protein [Medicago truncatula]
MQISLLHELVSGTPIIFDQFQNSVNRYLLDSTSHQCQYPSKHQSKSLTNSNKKRLARKADSLSQKVQEHVRLRANISETIKRKLSLGAQILQVGGVEKVFMRYFSVSEDESLLKISQCYLSTTSGPLAGLLFISNEKVAFCSDRSIKVFNQKGQMRRIRYKVTIPLKNIKCVNQSQNVEKPTQKYINIVTVDNFDFWFMGVFNYHKTFNYLEKAISQA